MNEWINWLFILCVNAIYWLEGITGMSYEAWNLFLFVFLQPILILVFVALWWHERSKRNANMQQRPLRKKCEVD